MADLLSTIAGSGASAWARGGASLAGALGSGSDLNELKGMQQGVTLQTKVLAAKKARDQATALAGLQQQLVENGVDPKSAGIVSSIVQAGQKANDVTGGLGKLQEQGIVGQQLEMAAGGATPQAQEGVNLLNAIRNGKPTNLTQVQGNTVINPTITPGSQELEMSPYGEASVGASRYRTDTQASTARGRGNYGNPGKNYSRTGTVDDDVKAAAEDAFYAARTAGKLPKGATIGDVRYQLRTSGQWVTPEGEILAKYSVSPEASAAADAPRKAGIDTPGIGSELAAAAAHGSKRSQNPTDPPTDVLTAAPVRPVSQRIQDARDALAKGADPAKVRDRLLHMGINPAAAGL